MFFADYHTHSDFSSDSDTPMEENIKKANYVESDGEVFGNEES